MPLILLGVTVLACGVFTIKRPDTRKFGGFGDPYVTSRRLRFTRVYGVLTFIMGLFFALYGLLQFL